MAADSADPDAPLALPTEPFGEPSLASPVTALGYAPAPQPAVEPISLTPHRRWTVGDLTYTARGLGVLFAFLLCGDFAYAMRERSVQPVVLLMLRHLHTSDTMVAFYFTTLPTALSLIISPIVSFKSDRYRGSWGRRIPFLLIPTPIAAGSMIGITYISELGAFVQRSLSLTPAHLDTCALGCFAVFWTLFEVAAVVAGSVLGGLINDVVPQQVLGRFYGLFRQVSLAAGILFNYWILGQAEVHFRAVLIGIAILFFAGFTIMCLNVKEGKYPPPPKIGDGHKPAIWQATEHYFRECFSLPYYCWLFVGITLASSTFIPINLFALLYARQLNVPTEIYGHLVAWSYVGSFLLASPLGWIVDRAHTLRVTIATLVLYGALMIGLGFVIHNPWTFGVALVLHTVLSGCYLTVSPPLGQALFPRISYGQYASAAGIVTSLFTMILGPVLGGLLDANHHDYRLTYFAAGAIGISAVAALLIVHRGFMRLGGPRAYVAPEGGKHLPDAV